MSIRALLGFLGLSLAMAATAAEYRIETVTENLDQPWGLAFLPEGELLVTERPGQLRRISAGGEVSEPLAGVPPVYFAGQGGLLDVVLHPRFPENGLIYLSYSHGDSAESATRVARAVLGQSAIENLDIILTVAPTKDTPQHYGGAMTFMADGTLLVTTGDGFDYREQAQQLGSMLGKTLRVNDDGSVPGNNPFVSEPGAAPEVWTYGHRNPQGLVVDADSGRVYQHEHGPRGGDELNLLRPGNNYGWPVITYGMDYNGAYVSPFTELEGMEQPLMYWVPSIAPSGMTMYRGEAFPRWQGDLFLGALVDREVRRIDLEDGQVAGEQALFAELGERIRNVETGPDGYLYILTDSEQGRVLRVEPR